MAATELMLVDRLAAFVPEGFEISYVVEDVTLVTAAKEFRTMTSTYDLLSQENYSMHQNIFVRKAEDFLEFAKQKMGAAYAVMTPIALPADATYQQKAEFAVTGRTDFSRIIGKSFDEAFQIAESYARIVKADAIRIADDILWNSSRREYINSTNDKENAQYAAKMFADLSADIPITVLYMPKYNTEEIHKHLQNNPFVIVFCGEKILLEYESRKGTDQILFGRFRSCNLATVVQMMRQ